MTATTGFTRTEPGRVAGLVAAPLARLVREFTLLELPAVGGALVHGRREEAHVRDAVVVGGENALVVQDDVDVVPDAAVEGAPHRAQVRVVAVAELAAGRDGDGPHRVEARDVLVGHPELLEDLIELPDGLDMLRVLARAAEPDPAGLGDEETTGAQELLDVLEEFKLEESRVELDICQDQVELLLELQDARDISVDELDSRILEGARPLRRMLPDKLNEVEVGFEDQDALEAAPLEELPDQAAVGTPQDQDVPGPTPGHRRVDEHLVVDVLIRLSQLDVPVDDDRLAELLQLEHLDEAPIGLELPELALDAVHRHEPLGHRGPQPRGLRSCGRVGHQGHLTDAGRE